RGFGYPAPARGGFRCKPLLPIANQISVGSSAVESRLSSGMWRWPRGPPVFGGGQRRIDLALSSPLSAGKPRNTFHRDAREAADCEREEAEEAAFAALAASPLGQAVMRTRR